MAVLDDPRFAEAFGPDSRAEVPLAAEIPPPSGKGPPLRINGQIDRLVARGNEVLIVDFKSNRRAPQAAGDIPEAYLLQLAAYRLAVSRIIPEKSVSAALLWTEVPALMPVPTELLDQVAARLWTAAA